LYKNCGTSTHNITLNAFRVHQALQVFLVLRWKVRPFQGLLGHPDLQEKLE
jgi:hypothetical protein